MDSYIHEKMQPIPLKKVTSFENSSELSLNHTFFDPSKMSPPNNFMDKLIKRMDTYYSPKDNSTLVFQYPVNK